jgi:outer membrane lipoprotein carrier protein
VPIVIFAKPRVVAVLAGVLLSFSAFASPSAVDRVEAYLGGLVTWSAAFRQTESGADGRVNRSAAGRFYLQRPGKFRWNYTAPAAQLLLSDGVQLWFYDEDLAQANVRSLGQSLASTPAMLLSGSGSIRAAFAVTSLPAEGAMEWYQLKPLRGDTDFREMRIAFKRREPVSMVLLDKLGSTTRLDFANTMRNSQLAANLFVFVPPAGVDVIGRAAAP